MGSPIPNLKEQLLVTKLLPAMAVTVSNRLDKVSNAMTVGLGATLAFIIGNIDKLSAYIDIARIKSATIAYIGIVILLFVQTRIAMKVVSGYKGGEIVRKVLSEGEAGPINFDVIEQQIIKSTLQPRKHFLRDVLVKAKKKREEGDIAWTPRRIARQAQRQEWTVFMQGALAIYVIFEILLAIE